MQDRKSKIVLSKRCRFEIIITLTELGCDLYQKAEANSEGSATIAVIRLDNNSRFTE
jgi:hypothetical protein